MDRTFHAIRSEKRLTAQLMGSPVIVGGVWIRGDGDGGVHACDVRNTMVHPAKLWHVALGQCIEATPALWKRRICLGTRGGFEFALGDA